MKKCPFRAEEIQEAAIKCRYCGTMLTEPSTKSLQVGAANSTRRFGSITESDARLLDDGAVVELGADGTVTIRAQEVLAQKGVSVVRLSPRPSQDRVMKKCRFCAEDIQNDAVFCRHCGRNLATGYAPSATTVVVQQGPVWSKGTAAVLSLVIPGAGQMYKGHVLSGLVWLIAVVIGYTMFIMPGLVLHFLCIILAASGDPTKPA